MEDYRDMKLSIGMMVKNESKYLERCLQSLQPLREAIESELIIVDTGSTDNTVEIAKHFTDKVYFHPWNDDFAAMRNITINYATGEWFLVIDGDEILQDSLPVIKFVQSPHNVDYGAAAVHVKNFTDERNWNKFSINQGVRLFRNDGSFSYTGVVHNQPVFKGKACLLPTVFLHYGYLSTDKNLMEEKFQRTATILKRELEKDPENIYYWYQLSVSYGMHNEYEPALQAIKRAYQLLQEKDQSTHKDHLYVYQQYVIMLSKLEFFEEIETVAKAALAHTEDLMDVHCLQAEAYLHLQQVEKSIESYEKYLSLVEEYQLKEHNTSVIDYTLNHKEKAYFNLCALYRSVGKLDKAIESIIEVKDVSFRKEAYQRLVALCYEQNVPERIRTYYEQVVSPSGSIAQKEFEELLEQLHGDGENPFTDEVRKNFAKMKGAYAIWNRWKLGRLKGKRLESAIGKISFQQLPPFYNALVVELFRVKACKGISHVFSSVTEDRWNQLVSYVHENEEESFERWIHDILGFFAAHKLSSEYVYCKLVRNLSRVAIFLSLGKRQPAEGILLQRYLISGLSYVRLVYSEKILSEVLAPALIADAEDLFFLRLWQAEKEIRVQHGVNWQDVDGILRQQYPVLGEVISYWQTMAFEEYSRKVNVR